MRDKHAVVVVNQAKLRGIDLPRDVGSIGHDNSPAAALPLIGLSSMDHYGDVIDRLAAEALLLRIGGREVGMHVLVRPELVCRRSC